MAQTVVALDIGGTKSAAALVTGEGTVLDVMTAPTPGEQGPEAILRIASGLAADLLVTATARGHEVAGLGVGSAGVIDASTGRVLSATEVLRNWAGTDVRGALSELSGIRHVVVDNDVHAHAIGESWLGAAAGASSAFFVAVGTGIGASVVIDGAVWHGRRNVAGHFGHVAVPHAAGLPCVCGGSGHLEAVAAGPAMVWAYNRRAGADLVPLADVARRADEGDRLAALTIGIGARALGSAIGGAANLLDPEVVVIGGGVMGVGPRWWEPMEEALRAELLPPLADLPVLPARLGPSAALVGAARLVWKDLS
ncbi:ROK family protein [Intrasporangium sp. DVR]|uniref:ROK family protein n=1 Tax=Intrasporangium sp. DVR TaxID=3127867 RepID=UPI00313A6F66